MQRGCSTDPSHTGTSGDDKVAITGGRKRKRPQSSDDTCSNQKKKTRRLVKEISDASKHTINKQQLMSPTDSVTSKPVSRRRRKSIQSQKVPHLFPGNEAGPSGMQNAPDSSTVSSETSSTNNEECLANEVNESVSTNVKSSSSKIIREVRSTKKEKAVHCPKCGRGFTSMKRLLQGHYDKTTLSCTYEAVLDQIKKPQVGDSSKAFSRSVNAALTAEKISEEELYAAIPEDASATERNAVWRHILKEHKVLKCQNEKCSHKSTSVSGMTYHVDRCGKVVEKLNCPLCGRVYTTKPGLNYHLSNCRQVTTEPVESDEVELSLVKRQAAIKASDSLANMGEVTSVGETANEAQSTAANDQLNSQGTAVDNITDYISEAEWAALKKEFRRNKETKCPSAHCSQMFKSISGLRYHLPRCQESKMFTCVICKANLTTWQRFQNHMLKKHDIGEDACIDREYVIPKELMPGSSDDEEEVTPKKKLQSSSRNLSVLPYFQLKEIYDTKLKKLVMELTSSKELFTSWQPSAAAWERCDPGKCPEYAPVITHPLRFRFANSESGSSPTSLLTLFDAILEDDKYGAVGATLNAGGPVWNMEWAPFGDEPSSTQYFAIATYRTLDETHRLDTIVKHKGLIQLWSVDLVDQLRLPQMSLAIAHDFGCIRSMKWCPSGCAANPTISCAQAMARLGLLALACSDGVVRILSIPYPKLLLEKFDPIKELHCSLPKCDVFVVPKSFCCILSPGNIINQSNMFELYGQCLDLEWLPRQPHNRIAASFSNGTVAIWDLLTSSRLLRGSHELSDIMFYPQQHISRAHHNVCRTLSWCPDHSDYLFTAGYDRRLCLWDLKCPNEPIERWDRVWCLDSCWPMLSPGVFYLEDSPTSVFNESKNLFYQDFQKEKLVTVAKSAAPQISFSYNQWNCTLAFGTVIGDVVLRNLPPFVNSFKSASYLKKSITTKKRSGLESFCFFARLCDMEEHSDEVNNETSLSSGALSPNKCLTFYNNPKGKEHQLKHKPDVYPLAAVNKVTWNPHHQHCKWLLVATNSGLVRLLKPI